MAPLRRLGLPLAGLLAAGSMAGGACLHLRADKRAVFQEVAGAYRGAVVLERAAESGHETRLVELVNHRGEAVSTAWVRRPAALSPNYRVVMVYSGANTGRKILGLIPLRPDLVLVAPQYPYSRPRTPFAVLHAALDARVPRVLLVHGGGDFPMVLRSIASRRGRAWRGHLEAWLAEALLDSFDPIHYIAEIAPREVVLIGAREDRYFPAASTLALYERAGQPKRLLWTEGAHVASRHTPALDEVLRQLELYLAGETPINDRTLHAPSPAM